MNAEGSAARGSADPSALSFVHRWLPGPRGDVTLLLLHGTGGDENDLLPLGAELAPGASRLSPRGAVLERGMPRFFRRIAEGVFDVPDLLRRTDDLAGFVAQAARAYSFDPARVVAVGFSNGANIAASLLLRHPRLLAGAALLRPMVPFTPEALPSLEGVPVLIGAGRSDPVAPPAEAERLASILKGSGAAVTLAWGAGGHGLAADDLAAARAWMAEEFPPN